MQRPKKYSTPQMMDFTSKIRQIVNRTSCSRHEKRVGQPCWWVQSDTISLYAAICNHRIQQQYDGKITDKSLSNKRPRKEHA